MPELPEVQAHAERLSEQFGGAVLERLVPFNFTALKTALPRPEAGYGHALRHVGRRGKYLLLHFEPVVFVVHLMQGGRLLVDHKKSLKPRNGQARFVFAEGPALLLTEAGKERKAGVWCIAPDALRGPPLDRLGPDALDVSAADLAAAFAAHSMRVHGFLRDQHTIAGLGRMLANEVCHRAGLSPFAMTGKLGAQGAAAVHAAIHAAIDDGLAYERTRSEMSSSADRPGAVHGRVGEPCPTCAATGQEATGQEATGQEATGQVATVRPDTVRSVSYSGYTVAYCPTCQTDGKVLADNTTSRFLK